MPTPVNPYVNQLQTLVIVTEKYNWLIYIQLIIMNSFADNTRVRVVLNTQPFMLESFLHSVQHGRSYCEY